MKKPKITSLISTSVYHLSGSVANIEWKVKNHFFVILKIGRKIKFFYKKNKISVFLYTSEQVKLYAIGDFAIDTREIDIIVRNSSRVKSNYKIIDQSIEMNDNISSKTLKDNDISLSNIDFTIKDIKLN